MQEDTLNPRPATPRQAGEVFNREAALIRLGNDQEFFASLIEFYLEDYPTLIAQVLKALQDRDARAMAQAAHSLKGLVGNFDAHDAVRLAARLEKAGYDQDLEAACDSVEPLASALAQLRDALLPYRSKAAQTRG